MHDWYIFVAWLMHSLMVQVEVQIGAWFMDFFMVHVDYKLFGQVTVIGYLYKFGAQLMNLFIMVQVDVWYMLALDICTCCDRLIGTCLEHYKLQVQNYDYFKLELLTNPKRGM